ncbi:hypothetical protein BH10PLA2_BH10PLA2_38570 [soil metagenome]
MRWQFANPNDRRETQERQQILQRIDAWWRAFAAKKDSLTALFSRKARWDLPAWMEENLQAIHPSIMWEYGPAVRTKGHRLVLTPESAHHLRPLVGIILQRAPKIEGWEFYPHRLPESEADALATVKGRTECDVGDYKVRISAGEYQRIDLCFVSPDISGPTDQDALNAAFVAAESLLGEELLDRWIGGIAVANSDDKSSVPSGNKPARPVTLDRLRETVLALIESIREQLPEQPQFERLEDAEWTSWKLEPGDEEDCFEQQDLHVAKSVYPVAWMAAHSGHLFFSERFSRCGETFCYLKVDGSEGLEDSQFEDKAEIEDALDEILIPAKLGCVIGGGTGKRYSYIDLALLNCEQSIQAVRQRLQEGSTPRSSWIQFYDADQGAEWVGIYDDTPPPPIRFDE